LFYMYVGIQCRRVNGIVTPNLKSLKRINKILGRYGNSML